MAIISFCKENANEILKFLDEKKTMSVCLIFSLKKRIAISKNYNDFAFLPKLFLIFFQYTGSFCIKDCS